MPGVLAALRALGKIGWPHVVITNQAVVGRGLMSPQTLADIHERMTRAVMEAGGRIDSVFSCIHRPDEDCICRKPHPGQLMQAADRLNLDLAHSFMVGDAETDILAAQAAGCRPVLVKTGRGREQLELLREHRVDGFHVAENLVEAVHWISAQVRSQGPSQFEIQHVSVPQSQRPAASARNAAAPRTFRQNVIRSK